jgi:altronate hydrolase
MSSFLQIHDNDNVAVALHDSPAGTTVTINGCQLRLKEDILAKQKVLLATIAKAEPVMMYGVPVGKSLVPLDAGQVLKQQHLVHTSATYSAGHRAAYKWTPPDNSRFLHRNFEGYYRQDGRVGTRNYWLMVPLVFCENQNIQTLQQAFERLLGYYNANPYEQRVAAWLHSMQQGKAAPDFTWQEDTNKKAARAFGQIDGIRFLNHQMGCGGSRQDARLLCKLLAGYINHPNVAGATVLSLGCQNATIEWLQEELYAINKQFSKPLFILDQQQTGTNNDLLNTAIDHTFSGLQRTNQISRTPQPLSKLVLGLKCGGSDGFSGISANPVLGYASDLLVSLGGSSILAEFPELSGVEQQLINRCVDEAGATKFERLMKDYAALSESFGNPFHNNPSEGNIKDGLLTDAMKSAGAARKGGDAPVAAVLDYGEPVEKSGLHLLCTPGNDVEATTGIAGSGANVTVFTTGLGTPTGNPVNPVIKISSNADLFKRMPDVLDFDCGGIIGGRQSIAECGELLLEKIISTASGYCTAAEQLRQNDFIPWRKSISV